MHKSLKLILFSFILASSSVQAAKQLNVLSIHSYHQEYPWTYSQYEAFKKQLKNRLPEYNINLELKKHIFCVSINDFSVI